MEDFETRLMNKYPNLFYKNELGELNCPCGVWVPQGWEKIVDNLCGAINNYITSTHRTEREIISKKFYIWHYLHLFLNRTQLWLIKLFPKLNKASLNKPFYNFLRKIFGKANQYSRWKKIYPPQVKIDQVKEKYSDLRVYVSGGDREIQGMISFAEYLCSKICQNTGEVGIKCKKNTWYATLSESEIKRLGCSTL